MNRSQIEHIIRAAGSITGDDEFIIIGSQAILGQFPDAPVALLQSIEVDMYPKNKYELADLIDGAIGELSAFHQTFGYYAHTVSEKTAALPSGWEKRLVPIKNKNTHGITGWCLEVYDLAASKYAAGRKRDRQFNQKLIKTGMLEEKKLRQRIKALPLPDTALKRILEYFEKDFSEIADS